MGLGNGGAIVRLALLTVVLGVLCAPAIARAQSGKAHAVVPGLPSPMPEAYVVMPFENRSGVSGLDWMRLAVPFVMAERAEGFARLRPAYGPLVTTAPRKNAAPIDAAAIAEYGKKHGATFVMVGWIERVDWKLHLGAALYRLQSGQAIVVATHSGKGEFKDVHAVIGEVLLALADEAKLRDAKDDLALVGRASSDDFYAFTLFGRALGGILTATNSSELDKAGQTMQRAVFIEPTMTEAQRLFADDQRRRYKPVLAKARLELVLKERPTYVAALSTLAKAARDRGQLMLAEDLIERVVRLRPWDLEARYELGMVYWERGRSPEAFEQLSIVAKHNPGHIRARRALVLIHAKRSDTASLVSELQAVAALAPKDVDTQLELAAALVAAKSTEKAIGVYKGIVELDASNVQALKFLGDLYRQQGHEARAIRYYGLAIAAAPKDPRSYFLLGAMYVDAGQDHAARRIYLKAQRFPKWRGEAYNNLGAIELRRNRVTQGVWYLRRAVQREGRRSAYRYNLALGLSKTRASDEALEHIDAALTLDSERAESHYLRGVILLRLGRAEEARTAFQETLTRAPSHADATHNLALLDAMKQRVTQGAVVTEGE